MRCVVGRASVAAWVAIVTSPSPTEALARAAASFLPSMPSIAHLPVGIQQKAGRKRQQDQTHEQPVDRCRRGPQSDHAAGENPRHTRQRNNPSTRESTRIIETQATSSSFSFRRILVRIFFAVFTPELVSGAVDEYIFQRRLADRNRLNLSGKCLDQVGHKTVPAFALDAHLIAQHGRLHVEARPDVVGQQTGVVGGIEQDHVAADLALQFCRRAQRHQIAFIHDGEAVATLGFFHQMRGHQHRNVLFIAQDLQVLPQIAPRSRIKASRRLIEQQHSRMMQQALGQFDAALHAAGKSFHPFLGAVGEAHARENFFDALLQRRSAQPIKMSLMPQILIGGQLRDRRSAPEKQRQSAAADCAGILRRIATHDDGAAAGRDHQGRENAKQRRLSAAVRAEQPEQFRRPDVERNTVQRRAVLIAMNQILYGNDGARSVRRFQTGISECSDFRNQDDFPGDYNQFTTFACSESATDSGKYNAGAEQSRG